MSVSNALRRRARFEWYWGEPRFKSLKGKKYMAPHPSTINRKVKFVNTPLDWGKMAFTLLVAAVLVLAVLAFLDWGILAAHVARYIYAR